MRTNLEVKKVSEEYGFDYLVRFGEGKPIGVVLDVVPAESKKGKDLV